MAAALGLGAAAGAPGRGLGLTWESRWDSLLTGCFFPQNIHVCLGGLFVPEAYITATRQYVAQANSWSLEELCLEVNVTTSQSATLDACSFGVTGELERADRGPLSASVPRPRRRPGGTPTQVTLPVLGQGSHSEVFKGRGWREQS